MAANITPAATAKSFPCGCGCGLARKVVGGAGRYFLPGHDAKLVSRHLRVIRDGRYQGDIQEHINNTSARIQREFGSLLADKYYNAAMRLWTKLTSKSTKLAEQRAIVAAAKEAVWVDATPVKVGRWEYPARKSGSRVQRNTKRDGSGSWIAV